jgi:CRISPR/Cas system-associated endonuclease Cas1
MDLMMERTEKTTEAMGIEGRQATLYYRGLTYSTEGERDRKGHRYLENTDSTVEGRPKATFLGGLGGEG